MRIRMSITIIIDKYCYDQYTHQYTTLSHLMMVIASKTDNEILKELGERLRAYRLQMNLAQAELATRAGVNRTTIRDAELGRDFQLTTLVKLLRVLGRLGDLDAFLPAPSVSPIQLMRRQGRPRQRARKPAHG